MDIRLIACDLDNTLLTDDKRLTIRNRRALEAAAARGILFVPTTGRIYHGIPEEILALPFLRYVITANGGGVIDCEGEHMLHKAEIPCEEGVRLAIFMRQYHTWYDCYQHEQGYVEEFYYRQIDTYCLGPYRAMVRQTRIAVQDLVESIKEQGDVQKMQMLFTDLELRKRAISEVEEAFPDIVVTASMENNAELNIRTANKGDALAFLCDYLGIDLAQTVAFGDGGNDVTLLEKAGIGVAMANALPSAKAAADVMTLSNEEDGVADYLERFIL